MKFFKLSRKSALLAAFCGGLVAFGIVFMSWLPLTKVGSMVIQQASMLLVFLPLLGLLIIPVASLGSFSAKLRPYALFVLVLGLSVFVGGISGVRLSGIVRDRAFAQLAERSELLVQSIHQFVEKEERVPQSLDELVPNYIESVPKTGMGAYPDYRLLVPETDVEMAERYSNNEWALIVDCSRGAFSWNVFVYYPNQNYPEYGFGGYTEKIGKWVYVTD